MHHFPSLLSRFTSHLCFQRFDSDIHQHGLFCSSASWISCLQIPVFEIFKYQSSFLHPFLLHSPPSDLYIELSDVLWSSCSVCPNSIATFHCGTPKACSTFPYAQDIWSWEYQEPLFLKLTFFDRCLFVSAVSQGIYSSVLWEKNVEHNFSLLLSYSLSLLRNGWKVKFFCSRFLFPLKT